MAKSRANRVLSERQQESRKRSHNIGMRGEFARATGSQQVAYNVPASQKENSSDHGKLSACGSINSRGLPKLAQNRLGASQHVSQKALMPKEVKQRVYSGSLNSRHRQQLLPTAQASQVYQNQDNLTKSDGTGTRRSQITQLKVDAIRTRLPAPKGQRNRNPHILTGSLDGVP